MWGSIPIGLKEYARCESRVTELNYDFNGIGEMPLFPFKSPTSTRVIGPCSWTGRSTLYLFCAYAFYLWLPEDIKRRPPTLALPSPALLELGSTFTSSSSQVCLLKNVGPLLPLWKEVAACVCPVLHSLAAELDFRVSVLLRGPKGSGRTTAAQAAAKALGMQIVVINSIELKV